MMIEVWLLSLLLASGEIAIEVKPTELACDAGRRAVTAEMLAAERNGVCPLVVAASCMPALATPETLTTPEAH